MSSTPVSIASAPVPHGGGADRPLIDWIIAEGWRIPCPKEFTAAFARHLVSLGLPLMRFRVTMRILHPQFFGVSYTWLRRTDAVETYEPPHEVLLEDRFRKSPYAGIMDGAGGMRRRLDVPGVALDEFLILAELRAEGATDYVAMPLTFSDGRISVITLAGDRPGGFRMDELALIDAALPLLSHIYEGHALRRTARALLDTYLGTYSGDRVLRGLIRRGDGENIHAAIWFCDLRASTSLSEQLSRAAFLEALNDFFDAMAESVLDHGGEVLRYIGDAALAIFPISAVTASPEICAEHLEVARQALAAAEDAIGRMAGVNARRRLEGKPELGFGIALHLGDVTYGNIGTKARLEFTVVGPAANEAARIESLCKPLNRTLLVSAEFAALVSDRFVSVGRHSLRGVGQPKEIFALRGS